jgi:hypothetical protein
MPQPILRLLFLLLVLMIGTPVPASAQVTNVLVGLFRSVNSVSFSGGTGVLLGGQDVEGTCGIGICALHLEVMLDLPAPAGATFELGLGTGVLRGFRFAEPAADFYGAARALPSIAAYATSDRLLGTSMVMPFGGLRIGFSQLWNARVYDPAGQVYSVGGEAFDFGAVAGIYLAQTALRGLYVELSATHRRFDSLNWSIPGTPVLPEGWPRSLDLSALEVTVGWQFRLTHAE